MDTDLLENQRVAPSLRSPLADAARVYRDEWCRNTFEEDVAWHLEHGYVFSTPSVFLMGYQENDRWHVSLCAGDVSSALSLMPFYLPYVSFERRNVLKVYKTDRIYEKFAVVYRQRYPLLQGWCKGPETTSSTSRGHSSGELEQV